LNEEENCNGARHQFWKGEIELGKEGEGIVEGDQSGRGRS